MTAQLINVFENEIWILIDSSSFGGIESHVYLLAKHLRISKILVRVVFLNDYGEHPLKQCLHKHNIPFTLLNGKFHTLYSMIKNRRPCLLHTHGYKANIFGKLIGKKLNVAVVSTYHSGGTTLNRIKFYNWLDERLAPLSRNIAVNKYIAKQLPCRTEVIENFVEIPKHVYLSKNSSATVAFVGRINEEKGPDLFCKLKSYLPDEKLEIFGDGEMRKQLENIYGNSIKFHGALDSINEQWKDIGILCMPSRFEGLPLVALEAMIHGVPVAAFDVGSLKDLITHEYNGYIVSPNDTYNMAQIIRSHLNLPIEIKMKISNNAINSIIQCYTADQLVPKIIKCYQSAIKNHSK